MTTKPLSTRILEYKEETIHWKDMPRSFSTGEVIHEYGEIRRIESQIDLIEFLQKEKPDLEQLLEKLLSELEEWRLRFPKA